MTSFNQRVDDLTDEDYHFQKPIDEHSFSSSQVKGASKNVHKFWKEAVQGEKSPYTSNTLEAFAIGHYFHTEFLEPEKLVDYVTFDGRRAGKVWNDFKEDNKDKKILTEKNIEVTKVLAQGVRESVPSMLMLDIPFLTEISFFSRMQGLNVKCRYDLLHENVKFSEHQEALEGIEFLHAKADWENLTIGGDLKSTAEADLEDEDTLRKLIKNYGYDISFAFYKDIYEIIEGKPLDAWYWIIASKKHARAKVVWADEDYYRLGRSKYTKGMKAILELKKDEWQFRDKAITLKPAGYELTSVQKETNEEDEI